MQGFFQNLHSYIRQNIGLYVFIGNSVAYVTKSERKLRIDTPDGKTVMRIDLPRGRVNSIAASGVTNRIAIGSGDGKIRIFDANYGKLMNTRSYRDAGRVEQLSFSPNGKYVMCCIRVELGTNEEKKARDKIIVWNPEKKEPKLEFISEHDVYSLSFSWDNRHISYIEDKMDSDTVFVVKNIFNSKTPVLRVAGTPERKFSTAILTPDNKNFVATIVDSESVHMFDFSGNIVFTHTYDDFKYHSRMDFLSDRRVAIYSGDIITVIDVERWIPQFKLEFEHEDRGHLVSYSRDSTRAVVSSMYDQVFFLKIPKDIPNAQEIMGVTFFPEYISKLYRDKEIQGKLGLHRMTGKIGDIITSYT